MTETVVEPASTEAPPRPRSERFPCFDGYRGIAAMLVLITHITESARFNNITFGEFFARMDAGVAIFFLISGFLLYRPFVLARFRGHAGPGIVSYFWRRALRIYPAFWVATLVAVYVFGEAPFGSPGQALLHLSLFHIYSPTTVLQGPILQSWTLGTEVSFYLFLPVYAAAIGWIVSRVRRALAVELAGVVALYAFSVAWQLMILASPGRLDGMYMTWLPAWLDLFSLGMFLAVVSAWTTTHGHRDRSLLARRWMPAACWTLSAIAFWAVATRIGLPRASIVYTRAEDMGRHVLYGATAFFLLLPGIFGPQDRGGIRRFLQLRVMVALGLVSYGLYLWHELWINQFLEWTGDHFGNSNLLTMFVVVLALTLAAAALSYHFIEQPALRLKGWAPVAKARVGDRWTSFVASLARVAPARGDRRGFARWLGLVGLGAFAIRVVYVLTIATHNPGFGDGFYYHAQANLLAAGKGFAEPFIYAQAGHVVPSAIHPPLFSLVLSLPSLVGLDSFLAHKITSCLIGTALVVAIGMLGRRIGGDRVGLVAAGLAAVYPNLWAIDGILLPEGLFALTVVLVVLATYRFLDRPGVGRAALLGGVIGLALLVRGEAIFLLAVIVLMLAIVLRARGWRSTVRWLAAMGAATLLVLAPWLIRNETQFARPVLLSTNSGDVLSQSNCEDTYYGPTIGYWSYRCSARIPVSGDESQQANQRTQVALDYIRDHRSRVPVVVAARVGRLWDVYQPLENTHLSTIEGRDINVSRAGLAMYALLVPFAILGFFLLRRRRRPMLFPLLAPVAMVTITAITTYGEIRFRAAAEATIVVLAALTVDALLRRRSAVDLASLDGVALDTASAGTVPEALAPDRVPVGAAVPARAQSDLLVSPAVQIDAPVVEPAPNGDQGPRPIVERRWSLDRLSQRTRTALLVTFLAVLVLLPVRGMLRSQGPPMEEGFMLVFPARVLAGAVANRDFLHLYGPGSLWVLAGVYKLFGVTLQVERLFALLQQIAVITGVVLLARRWGRTAAAFCGALAIVFLMPPIGLTALAWVGGLGLALLGVACCVEVRRARDDVRARRWALGAGLLFAVALLYRPELVLAIALGGGALLWGTTRAVKTRLAAGLGLAVVGYAVHTAMAGVHNVWQGMVIDPLFHLRGGRSLPVPPSFSQYDGWLQRVGEIGQLKWFPALQGPTQLALWFFGLVGCAALLLVVGIRTFRRDRSSLNNRILLAIALFSLGILPQALQRDDSTHLAWVSCVVIAFAPLALIELLRRRRPTWSMRRCAAVCGAGLLAVIVVVIPYSEVRSYADYTLQSFGIHRSAHEVRRGDQVFYYGRYDAWQALQELIPAVEKIEKPGDRLFVGTGDLRKTPFSEAWLYYMFPELTPATYYIEMDPGIANGKHSRSTRDVESADIVILSTVWDGFDEPNDSEKFGPDTPNKVLRDKFCTVGEYGGGLYKLLTRCKPWSASRYVLGVALVIAVVAALAFGSRRVRARLLPDWTGAPARLAEVLLGTTALILVPELLGAVGQFRRWPVALALAFVGLAAGGLAGAPKASSSTPQAEPAPQPKGARAVTLAAFAVCAVVFAQWSAHVVSSYRAGIWDGDTIWYHLTFAAHFVQSGWVTHPIFTNSDTLVTYFPANAEVVNAVAILPFGHDVLLPLVNLLWLALALLAGWCIGRFYGAAPVGLTGVAVVMSLPVVAATQAGTARNDAAAIALYLTAIALVLHARWRPAGLALGGLAAGLALGVKLSMVPAVALLALAVLVVAPAGARRRLALPWLGPLVGAGAFWYVRNLVLIGNPVPTVAVHVGPLSLPSIPVLGTPGSIVDHLGDPGAWGDLFHPGLQFALGDAWWVVLLVMAVPTALILLVGRDRLARALAAVTVLAVAAYAFLPNSAPGSGLIGGLNFGLNVRYALPAIAAATALTASLPYMASARGRGVSVAVFALAVGLGVTDRKFERLWEWQVSSSERWIGLAAVALAAAVIVAVSAVRRGRHLAFGIAIGVVLVVVTGGWWLQRSYLRDRYANPRAGEASSPSWVWAQGLPPTRIGIVGDLLQYPYTGRDLATRVRYIGVELDDGGFRSARTCREWRHALAAGRFQYVVLSPNVLVIDRSDIDRAKAWTTTVPGTSTVFHDDHTEVFRLTHSPDPDTCP